MQIYADGPQPGSFQELVDQGAEGFTSNPSLAKDTFVGAASPGWGERLSYREWATLMANLAGDVGKPISLEVIADDMLGMHEQAEWLAALGEHVWVKIPCCTIEYKSTHGLTARLCEQGIKVNVTAITSGVAFASHAAAMDGATPSILSVFAGRLSDLGCPAAKAIKAHIGWLDSHEWDERPKVLWGSVREVWNIYEAESIGCDIVTVPPPILKKFIGGQQTATAADAGLAVVRQFSDAAKGFTW